MEIYKKIDPLFIVITLLLAVIGGGFYYYLNLHWEKESLEKNVADLNSQVDNLQNEKENLSEALFNEKNKNDLFAKQIEDIGDMVNDLDKLSKTDPELLTKYSKVYFLNENYRPANLKQINEDYVAKDGQDEWIHGEVRPFLEDLLEEAENDEINLQIISAFRGFDEQKSLKSQYTVVYGETSANRFSADQGYSEHQLGTAVDFTTKELGLNYTSLENTEAYEWLKNNAYKFGFTLSYPPNNEYYIFEPWHWRFVGKSLAKKLHKEEKYFYDLDQREINKYLISLFD